MYKKKYQNELLATQSVKHRQICLCILKNYISRVWIPLRILYTLIQPANLIIAYTLSKPPNQIKTPTNQQQSPQSHEHPTVLNFIFSLLSHFSS